MATLIAPTAAVSQYSGDQGNLSVAHGFITFAAAAINDTAYMVKLFAGTKITNVKLVNAALGAGVTLDVGTKHVDNSAGDSATAFFTAQAASAAGSNQSAVRPLILAKDAYILLTVKGGAATGLVDVVVEYEFRGL